MKPETIKDMCELAEGFVFNRETNEVEYRYLDNNEFYTSTNLSIVVKWAIFPIFLRRAVDGWNKKNSDGFNIICIDYEKRQVNIPTTYPLSILNFKFENYQSTHLTQCEQAIKGCLEYVLEDRSYCE